MWRQLTQRNDAGAGVRPEVLQLQERRARQSDRRAHRVGVWLQPPSAAMTADGHWCITGVPGSPSCEEIASSFQRVAEWPSVLDRPTVPESGPTQARLQD